MPYRCPQCRADLPVRDDQDALRCRCGANYRSATVGDLAVLDFLGGTVPGRCGCPADQRTAPCRVDLAAPLDAAPRPPRHHPKRKILRRFASWRDRLVLDVGCREGPLGHELAASNRVIGVDRCPQKTLLDEPNLRGKGYAALLLADAVDLPLRDAQVDLLLATDLLEHLTEPERALTEFHRVLRPGGELLVAVPNLVSYNNRLSILIGSGVGLELHRLLRGQSPVHPISGVRYPDQRMHLRFFTGPSLHRTLTACGFAVRAVWGFDPVLSRLPGTDRLLRGLCLWTVAVAQRSPG